MAQTTQTTERPPTVIPGAKQQFLEALEREHERTMRVLRAYPARSTEAP